MNIKDFIKNSINVKSFTECTPRLMTVTHRTDAGRFLANADAELDVHYMEIGDVVIRIGDVELSLGNQIALIKSDGLPIWLYESEVEEVDEELL